ncbi:MgtC/SapB family protein [Dapis sp. BLCC M126]|uniref:MgtC/SapB family protein n=1 Tax=Dapis sp. BLCC M126 TaxID=3400189 RepID=UPI003CF648CA
MIEKIIAAAVLGGILGLERELRHKPAGVKTNAVVAIAACSFLLLVEAIDPTEKVRMMTGIVQGVGFIGGGIILREGLVARGLTSAAVIWVSAALGLACATGEWKLAVVILLATLLVLRGTRLFLRKDEENT